MRLYAMSPAEDDVIDQMAKELCSKGIVAEAILYEDAFAATIWSIDDLATLKEAEGWSPEEKIRFMEYAEHGLHEGLVTEGWVCLRDLLENYKTDFLDKESV